MAFNFDRSEKECINEIRQKITSDPQWAEKAIVTLYGRQTENEQVNKETSEENGQGFTGVDAAFMSSLAEWILKGRHLTNKQLDKIYPKLGKYSRQLYKIAKSKNQSQNL